MFIYRTLSILLFPLIELYLILRVVQKKEDKRRLKERFGRSTKIRPEGQVIWIHAVSVGEANSSMILVSELLKFVPNISILFTTTTLTSASVVESKIPSFKGRVIHQFLPVDSYFCVKNFLDFWKPRAAVFVESEVWPNLIFEARMKGISAFLVNARMSEKSFKKWRAARFLGFNIFEYFTTIFAQTENDRKRFEQLSNQEILFYGNLKSQAQNLDFSAEELERLKGQIGSRKFWLAASTHKGEEEIVIAAHKELKKDFPDLVTILVPRHPVRADEIKSLFGDLNFAQRSENQPIEPLTEIYLADSLNEMGIFYRLAPFAFIGGSMAEVGGHNPFEAIKLRCAVISGRHVFNFKEVYANLEGQNGCVMTGSKDELVATVKRFLQNEIAYETIISNAARAIGNSDNIAGKIVEKMDRILMLGV